MRFAKQHGEFTYKQLMRKTKPVLMRMIRRTGRGQRIYEGDELVHHLGLEYYTKSVLADIINVGASPDVKK